MDDPKQLVAAGYDAMAPRFDEWQKEVIGSPRMRYLDKLLALLPPRPDVLELGCGAGVESTRILAERGRLTGVDISEAQLELARARSVGDIRLRGSHRPQFRGGVIRRGSRPIRLVSLAESRAGPAPRPDQGLAPPGRGLPRDDARARGRRGRRGLARGADVLQHLDVDADRELFRDAGLAILLDETVVQKEPEGDLPFHWMLAQKSKA